MVPAPKEAAESCQSQSAKSAAKRAVTTVLRFFPPDISSRAETDAQVRDSGWRSQAFDRGRAGRDQEVDGVLSVKTGELATEVRDGRRVEGKHPSSKSAAVTVDPVEPGTLQHAVGNPSVNGVAGVLAVAEHGEQDGGLKLPLDQGADAFEHVLAAADAAEPVMGYGDPEGSGVALRNYYRW